ncbi:MAG: polysaccharide biosynthesis tyrosine autokinase [Flavobacteriia bacterium]|nr:polysaccharide biosynthesis tyrosine autokinase [Flavobacteriia bacterium]
MNAAQKSLIINKGYNPYLLRAVLRRFWYLPFVMILLFMFSSWLYLRYTKDVFKSSAILQIEKNDQGKELLEIENNNIKNNILGEVELLRSELLFKKAVDKLNMNISIFSKGKILTEELYNNNNIQIIPYYLSDSSFCETPINIEVSNKKAILISYQFLGKNHQYTLTNGVKFKNNLFEIEIKVANFDQFIELQNENQLYFVFNNSSNLFSRLFSGLEVSPADEVAQTILITYKGNNPILCKDIVDKVAESFFEYDEQNQKQSSVNILKFIDKQLDSIGTELKFSKDSLTRFQKATKLADPETDSRDINQNIVQVSDKLFELDNEINTLKLVNSKLKNEPNRVEIYKLIPEMLGKSFESSLSKQIQDLYTLIEKKEDLLFEITEDNAVIRDINLKISNKITSIRRSVNVILERLSENEKLLRGKLADYENAFFSIPDKKTEYNRLKSAQELNEKYYTLLAEKKVMYSISRAGFSSENRLLSTSTVSSTPISPNRKMVYGGFLFVGLLIGLTYLAFKYFTFNEINNTEELKMLLPEKANILGSVPITKRTMDYSQIVVHESPKSLLAESLRHIRANMSFVNKNAQVIAISSSISGEGKTFIALNLAAIIAMSGKKTLIMDLDLRKPKVHLGFNVNNDNGMSNLIVSQVTLNDCIHHSEIDNLHYITAGPVPPNPSELILSREFQTVLEKLKTIYEIIIIDNPPVGLVSDGVQVLASADIPIYVFKANYSKRIFAERVKELFEVQQLKSLNILLNGTVPGRGGYGYDYGYSYGYGYGYGYGSGYYYDEKHSEKFFLIRWYYSVINFISRRI